MRPKIVVFGAVAGNIRRTFMRTQSITLLAAVAALLAVVASPALAKDKDKYKDKGGISAPGPIAGAGLGYLVLAGGYYVVRRWRKQKTGEKATVN
jgi:hypothetical protein